MNFTDYFTVRCNCLKGKGKIDIKLITNQQLTLLAGYVDILGKVLNNVDK